ncbi:MAG: hypothetical protein Q9182_001275 [Xanthomendoza sp. 2 TL-2023]
MTAKKPTSEPSVAKRIEQLNQIDRDVAKLLESAGLAIKSLTCANPETDRGQDDQRPRIEQRKERFVMASSQYFSLLSSIDVRLRRHISALEDAEIIPSETTAKDLQTNGIPPTSDMPISNSFVPRPAVSSRDTIVNGGLGNLDIGWLNSRNNNVEKDMKAELWNEAHQIVKKTLEAQAENSDVNDMPMSDNAAPT